MIDCVKTEPVVKSVPTFFYEEATKYALRQMAWANNMRSGEVRAVDVQL